MAHLLYTLEYCYGEDGYKQYSRTEKVTDFPGNTTLDEISKWVDRCCYRDGVTLVGNIKLIL